MNEDMIAVPITPEMEDEFEAMGPGEITPDPVVKEATE